MRKGIKKLLTVALTATLGLAALAGCGTGTSSNGDGSANGGTTKELSGKIQLAGSTSMEKMCGALMEAFMEEYPNVTVKLMAYFATVISGEIKLSVHDEAKWISISEVENFKFAPADIPFIEKLKEVL